MWIPGSVVRVLYDYEPTSKNAIKLHHNFSDPSKLKSTSVQENKVAFRKTREEIKKYCNTFVKTNLSIF